MKNNKKLYLIKIDFWTFKKIFFMFKMIEKKTFYTIRKKNYTVKINVLLIEKTFYTIKKIHNRKKTFYTIQKLHSIEKNDF